MEKFYQAITSEMMLYCCMTQLKITSPNTLTFTMVILFYFYALREKKFCETDAIVKLKPNKCEQINWISETFERFSFLRNGLSQLLHNCRFPGENRKGLGNSELWSRINVIA